MFHLIALVEEQPHKSLYALKSPINRKGAGNWLTRLSRSLCATLKCGGIHTLHTVIVLCRDTFTD